MMIFYPFERYFIRVLRHLKYGVAKLKTSIWASLGRLFHGVKVD